MQHTWVYLLFCKFTHVGWCESVLSTCFTVLYGCVRSIQFPFDVLKLANLFCFCGVEEFYVYGSVYRWSILIIVQRDATQSSLFIILQVHSTSFGCQPHPSSGVHKTVTTASGTSHIFCAATSFQRGQASLATLEGGSCTVPEAVVTVLCTPNDGCGWHPKHVEWTCRIIDCFVLHLVGQLLV